VQAAAGGGAPGGAVAGAADAAGHGRRDDGQAEPQVTEPTEPQAEAPTPVTEAPDTPVSEAPDTPATEPTEAKRPAHADGDDRLMLLPKKTKYRKQQRGRRAGYSRANRGLWRLWAEVPEAGWLTNRQIEAARIAMTRKIKRGGRSGSTSSPTAGHAEAGRDAHGLR
jgi:large subunit ribosomal protein L16